MRGRGGRGGGGSRGRGRAKMGADNDDDGTYGDDLEVGVTFCVLDAYCFYLVQSKFKILENTLNTFTKCMWNIKQFREAVNSCIVHTCKLVAFRRHSPFSKRNA